MPRNSVAINAVRVSRQGGGGMDHYTILLVNSMAQLGLDFDLWTFVPEHFPQVPENKIRHPFFFLGISHRKRNRSGPASASDSVPDSVSVSAEKISATNEWKKKLSILLGDSIKMFWIQVFFPLIVWIKKYKIVFAPSQIDAFPWKIPGAHQIISVLDLIPFLLPDQPNKHSVYLKYFFPVALENAAHLITISENTKRDVHRLFAVPNEKMTNILLAQPLQAKKMLPPRRRK